MQIHPVPHLILIKETENGLFYSQNTNKDEKEMIESLATSFEGNYERITQLFEFTPPQKTIIHIYTSKEEFHSVIGRDTEGTYDAEENIIKVYTPAILSRPAIHEEYTYQLVHEFVHAVIPQINPMVGNVKWLDEGIAYYASNQLKSELKSRSIYPDIPSLEQLQSST
jgi:hypothetical protein